MNILYIIHNTTVPPVNPPLSVAKRTIYCIEKSAESRFIAQDDTSLVEIPIHGKTGGSACTLLLAAEYIDNDSPLLVADFCAQLNEHMESIYHFFENSSHAGGVVAFDRPQRQGPYAKTDDDGMVIEIAEHHAESPVSSVSLAHCYFFRRGADCVLCVKDVIRKDNPIKGTFTLGQVINEMILQQKDIRIYSLQ